jgi:hypothetical protein
MSTSSILTFFSSVLVCNCLLAVVQDFSKLNELNYYDVVTEQQFGDRVLLPQCYTDIQLHASTHVNRFWQTESMVGSDCPTEFPYKKFQMLK